MHPGTDESGPVPLSVVGGMMTRERHDRDRGSTRGKEPNARRPHSATHHGSHPRPSLSHRTFSHYSNLLHNLKTERPPRIPPPTICFPVAGVSPGRNLLQPVVPPGGGRLPSTQIRPSGPTVPWTLLQSSGYGVSSPPSTSAVSQTRWKIILKGKIRIRYFFWIIRSNKIW